MINPKSVRVAAVCALAMLCSTVVFAQIDARMFRQPSVSKDQIAFVYAGDIWLVPKKGGAAVRLTSSPGEESFPRFSPDGTKVAYSASYDGNLDVYVAPASGGEPKRLTYHPMADRVIGWTPDGKRVLFASSRESGRQRYNQFYTVSLDGGLPEKLPVPYGEFGTYSPDAQAVRLHADVAGLPELEALSRRLGAGSDAVRSEDVRDEEHHEQPGERCAADVARQHDLLSLRSRCRTSATTSGPTTSAQNGVRQVTQFTDFDITFPSIGPDCDRVSGRRPALPARPRDREAVRGPGPRRHRRDDAAAADGEGRVADQVGVGVADREARRLRGARRHLHGAGRVRRGRQRHALVRRVRALSAVVARRQDRGVLERSHAASTS